MMCQYMRPPSICWLRSQRPHPWSQPMVASLSTTVMTFGLRLDASRVLSHWSSGFLACSGARTACSYSQSAVLAMMTMLAIVDMLDEFVEELESVGTAEHDPRAVDDVGHEVDEAGGQGSELVFVEKPLDIRPHVSVVFASERWRAEERGVLCQFRADDAASFEDRV